MMRMTTSLVTVCLLAAASPAQRGYEWDQADGLGVRYLLYRKLKPEPVKADEGGPYLRARYVPTDESEWVKYKGTEWRWGVAVYEFPRDGSGLERVEDILPARDFEDFVLRQDPGRSPYRYVAVEGTEMDGSHGKYRHWEYFDVYPGVAGEEPGYRPAGGGLFRAEDLELGIRYLIADGMYRYYDAEKARPASHERARYIVVPKHRVNVKSRPLPVTWSLVVRHFEKGAPEGPESFEDLVRSSGEGRRDIEVAGEERKVGGRTVRWWRWFDRGAGAPGKAVNHHVIAASYGVGGDEVALEVAIPTDDRKVDRRLETMGRRIAASLETMTDAERKRAAARPLRGFVSYKVAGCHRVGEREVVVVVRHPVVKGRKPTRRQLERARKMVSSVEPSGR